MDQNSDRKSSEKKIFSYQTITIERNNIFFAPETPEQTRRHHGPKNRKSGKRYFDASLLFVTFA